MRGTTTRFLRYLFRNDPTNLRLGKKLWNKLSHFEKGNMFPTNKLFFRLLQSKRDNNGY